MVKKKVVPKKSEPKKKQLTSEQYHRWAFRVEEIKNAKLYAQLETKKVIIHELELKVKNHEASKQKIAAANANMRDKRLRQDFENDFIKDFEKELGYSLGNVTIDPITLEVKELD